MPQVAAALAAGDFNTMHAVTEIVVLLHAIAVQHIPKTGPARAGVVLALRGKQRLITAHAAVKTGLLAIGVQTRKGWLSAFFAADMVLLGAKVFSPIARVGHGGSRQ